jgi:hypothetical protein
MKNVKGLNKKLVALLHCYSEELENVETTLFSVIELDIPKVREELKRAYNDYIYQYSETIIQCYIDNVKHKNIVAYDFIDYFKINEFEYAQKLYNSVEYINTFVNNQIYENDLLNGYYVTLTNSEYLDFLKNYYGYLF